MITNITDFLMILCIFTGMLTVVIYLNTYNKQDRNLLKELQTQIKKETKLDEISKSIDGIYGNNQIIEKNKDGIDLHNISNPQLRLQDIIDDIDNMINIVFVTELYSIEIQGVNISTDKELKRVGQTLTQKVVSSISVNFRAKIYLFINENLLVEIVYSNIMRRLLNIASVQRGIKK